jgi:hypothetical protein
MTGTAREEAERLVATVLAMASQSRAGSERGGGSGLGDLIGGVVGSVLGGDSGSGGKSSSGGSSAGSGRHTGKGWATGSAECCVCPVCRAMAAARDPNPLTAARLAAGAGDFATGVAGLMRAFSSVAEGTKRRPEPKKPEPTPDQSWAAATRATATPAAAQDEPTIDESADPWTAATREDDRSARHEAVARQEAARQKAAERQEKARHEAAEREAARQETARQDTAREASSPLEGPAASRRTGKEAGKTVTRPTDPWAAAVANDANGDSRRETGVARTGGVDHDVAAHETPAEAGDRDDRLGGDAPGGAE